MAKRTHHTNRNQSFKEHRNGIKRPKKHRLVDTPGIHPAILRNNFFSKKHNNSVASE